MGSANNEYRQAKKLTPLERAAWECYCQDTAGDMDVRDYWEQLPRRVQEIYLAKVS
jgi:hypothetical protein